MGFGLNAVQQNKITLENKYLYEYHGDDVLTFWG